MDLRIPCNTHSECKNEEKTIAVQNVADEKQQVPSILKTPKRSKPRVPLHDLDLLNTVTEENGRSNKRVSFHRAVKTKEFHIGEAATVWTSTYEDTFKSSDSSHQTDSSGCPSACSQTEQMLYSKTSVSVEETENYKHIPSAKEPFLPLSDCSAYSPEYREIVDPDLDRSFCDKIDDFDMDLTKPSSYHTHYHMANSKLLKSVDHELIFTYVKDAGCRETLPSFQTLVTPSEEKDLFIDKQEASDWHNKLTFGSEDPMLGEKLEYTYESSELSGSDISFTEPVINESYKRQELLSNIAGSPKEMLMNDVNLNESMELTKPVSYIVHASPNNFSGGMEITCPISSNILLPKQSTHRSSDVSGMEITCPIKEMELQNCAKTVPKQSIHRSSDTSGMEITCPIKEMGLQNCASNDILLPKQSIHRSSDISGMEITCPIKEIEVQNIAISVVSLPKQSNHGSSDISGMEITCPIKEMELQNYASRDILLPKQSIYRSSDVSGMEITCPIKEMQLQNYASSDILLPKQSIHQSSDISGMEITCPIKEKEVQNIAISVVSLPKQSNHGSSDISGMEITCPIKEMELQNYASRDILLPKQSIYRSSDVSGMEITCPIKEMELQNYASSDILLPKQSIHQSSDISGMEITCPIKEKEVQNIAISVVSLPKQSNHGSSDVSGMKITYPIKEMELQKYANSDILLPKQSMYRSSDVSGMEITCPIKEMELQNYASSDILLPKQSIHQSSDISGMEITCPIKEMQLENSACSDILLSKQSSHRSSEISDMEVTCPVKEMEHQNNASRNSSLSKHQSSDICDLEITCPIKEIELQNNASSVVTLPKQSIHRNSDISGMEITCPIKDMGLQNNASNIISLPELTCYQNADVSGLELTCPIKDVEPQKTDVSLPKWSGHQSSDISGIEITYPIKYVEPQKSSFSLSKWSGHGSSEVSGLEFTCSTKEKELVDNAKKPCVFKKSPDHLISFPKQSVFQRSEISGMELTCVKEKELLDNANKHTSLKNPTIQQNPDMVGKELTCSTKGMQLQNNGSSVVSLPGQFDLQSSDINGRGLNSAIKMVEFKNYDSKLSSLPRLSDCKSSDTGDMEVTCSIREELLDKVKRPALSELSDHSDRELAGHLKEKEFQHNNSRLASLKKSSDMVTDISVIQSILKGKELLENSTFPIPSEQTCNTNSLQLIHHAFEKEIMNNTGISEFQDMPCQYSNINDGELGNMSGVEILSSSDNSECMTTCAQSSSLSDTQSIRQTKEKNLLDNIQSSSSSVPSNQSSDKSSMQLNSCTLRKKELIEMVVPNDPEISNELSAIKKTQLTDINCTDSGSIVGIPTFSPDLPSNLGGANSDCTINGKEGSNLLNTSKFSNTRDECLKIIDNCVLKDRKLLDNSNVLEPGFSSTLHNTQLTYSSKEETLLQNTKLSEFVSNISNMKLKIAIECNNSCKNLEGFNYYDLENQANTVSETDVQTAKIFSNESTSSMKQNEKTCNMDSSVSVIEIENESPPRVLSLLSDDLQSSHSQSKSASELYEDIFTLVKDADKSIRGMSNIKCFVTESSNTPSVEDITHLEKSTSKLVQDQEYRGVEQIQQATTQSENKVVNLIDPSLKEDDKVDSTNLSPTKSKHDDVIKAMELELSRSTSDLWNIKERTDTHWSFQFLYKSLELRLILGSAIREVGFSYTREITDIQLISHTSEKAVPLVKLAHRVFLQEIQVEKLKLDCKTTEDVPGILNLIIKQVTKINIFMRDFVRLETFEMARLEDNEVIFDVAEMEIRVWFRVHVRLNNFENIVPADVSIKSIVGSISEDEVKRLVTAAKRGPRCLLDFTKIIKEYIKVLWAGLDIHCDGCLTATQMKLHPLSPLTFT